MQYTDTELSNLKRCARRAAFYWLVPSFRHAGIDVDEQSIMDAAYHAFLRQGGVCPLTGVKLCIPPTRQFNEPMGMKTVRLDPNRAWSLDNIVWVHVPPAERHMRRKDAQLRAAIDRLAQRGVGMQFPPGMGLDDIPMRIPVQAAPPDDGKPEWTAPIGGDASFTPVKGS